MAFGGLKLSAVTAKKSNKCVLSSASVWTILVIHCEANKHVGGDVRIRHNSMVPYDRSVGVEIDSHLLSLTGCGDVNMNKKPM